VFLYGKDDVTVSAPLFDLELAFEQRKPLIQAAIDRLATGTSSERGAVFTRSEIAGFMLDLNGYTAEQDLCGTRLLEPSFGSGEFLIPAVRRRLESYFRHGGTPTAAAVDLRTAFLAVELHHATFDDTRQRLDAVLAEYGQGTLARQTLLDAWLQQDDFLLTNIEGEFTHVIGNPPYLRSESIPPVLLSAYRARYQTMTDRADLFIPFFERTLDLLSPGGALCFICSDRWFRNKYGGALRQKIANGYHLQAYVDLVGVVVFQSDVTAYPAITLVARDSGHETRLSRRPPIDTRALTTLAAGLRGQTIHPDVECIPLAIREADPWLLDLGPALAVLRNIEARFPLLEDVGASVGIGVATGADRVYIGPLSELDVEEDRKVPLGMAADVRSGVLKWSGLGVINPFAERGGLVDLKAYPRLQAYLQQHEQVIRARNVAQRTPAAWYRTIDRITPALTRTPKLLIPDMNGQATVAYDPGTVYPHHNLYFVTSSDWDLRALQTVLRSRITTLFMGAYSVKMRGGTLRYQAQYLRRLRLPRWGQVPEALQQRLKALAESRDAAALNTAVDLLYGLDQHAIRVLNEV